MQIKHLAGALALTAIAVGAQAQQGGRKPYVIELLDAPAASYAGGVSGLSATRPAAGPATQCQRVHGAGLHGLPGQQASPR